MDKTGGSAFPGKVYTGQTEYVEGIGNRHVMEDVPGMTLRDYFAAKAMPWVASDVPAGDNFHALVAKFSYVMADAMLAERSKT